MKKDVMIVTGAGQISMAIARRCGFGKKIILGDKNMKNCETIAKIMNDAGFVVEPFEMDLSSRESIKAMIAIRICLRSARQAVRELRMRWRI